MGEFGRTPRHGACNFSNNTNNVGGRDHWCNCYSVVLAGGGVRGGQVVGSSDCIGGYPKRAARSTSATWPPRSSTPWASIRAAQLYDIQGQLRIICDGNPVAELF